MNAVEVSSLEKRFGRVRALRGLSVQIPVGDLCLLTGPNGAGKSTLLRVLACLTRPTKGEVRILGVDPFHAAHAATRGRIGYLGAEPSLYGQLSVEENLHFCARLHGVARERIEEVVSDLGLDAVRHQRVFSLSSGFQRRAGLARAVLPEPELLLLDEPWNGLDADASERLARLLARCRERRITALIAAHGLDGSTARFDRVLRIERGELSSEEPPG